MNSTDIFTDIDFNDPELIHYGIKGMKWGIRRTPEQLGHKVSSSDTSKSKMSDDELNKTMIKSLNSIDVHIVDALRNNDSITEKDIDQIIVDSVQAISKTIYTNRTGSERDKLYSELSSGIDGGINDSSGVLAIDKNSGTVRSYESTHSIDRSSEWLNGGYSTSTLDKHYGYDADSTDYYVWGEKQGRVLEQSAYSEDDDYLSHFGIKGMKWGIRRYQNSDGSLTAAGTKRYGTQENFEKVQAVKAAGKASSSKESKATKRTEKEISKLKKKYGMDDEEESTSKKKKSLSEMSDEEVYAKANRLKLENTLKRELDTYNALNQKEASKGKKFVESLVSDVIAPAAKNTGRKFLEDKMGDALGLNKNTTEALRKKLTNLQLKQQIEDLTSEAAKGDRALSQTVTRARMQSELRNYERDSNLSDLSSRVAEARLNREYRNYTTVDPFEQMRTENRNYQTWETNRRYREQFYNR